MNLASGALHLRTIFYNLKITLIINRISAVQFFLCLLYKIKMQITFGNGLKRGLSNINHVGG